MSAYGHEMEREYSAQSILSRGASDRGSHYTIEGGIFMSSFAATVFISALVTLGISFLSLLVALFAMLHACESRHSGVVEMYRYRNSYDYCRNFALHAELNSLSSDTLPAICKDIDTLYVKEGQYKKDLHMMVGMAEDYFGSFRPQYDGRDAVLMDADDLVPEALFTYRINKEPFHDVSRDAEYFKHDFTRKLYVKLQAGGWPLILFTRKPEKLRNATAEYLVSAGCSGWFSLIMRKENETQMDFQEFLSRQRIMLQREGSQIIAVISSQMDALRGSCLGDRVFKLPSPMYRYSMKDHVESQIRKSIQLQPKN